MCLAKADDWAARSGPCSSQRGPDEKDGDASQYGMDARWNGLVHCRARLLAHPGSLSEHFFGDLIHHPSICSVPDGHAPTDWL